MFLNFKGHAQFVTPYATLARDKIRFKIVLIKQIRMFKYAGLDGTECLDLFSSLTYLATPSSFFYLVSVMVEFA